MRDLIKRMHRLYEEDDAKPVADVKPNSRPTERDVLGAVSGMGVTVNAEPNIVVVVGEFDSQDDANAKATLVVEKLKSVGITGEPVVNPVRFQAFVKIA